jgi:protein-L-isoaspartate(D-aspartate) O-methyltransferase
MSPLELSRAEFAERIRALGDVRSDALVRAFATLPREDFVGPGPWQIIRLEAGSVGYETTPDANPRRIYDNVLVALDPARQLNNGEPAALARWLDSLDLAPGERLLHVGSGVGYYTAIAALALQPGGSAVGLEIDPELATRARTNLARCGASAVVGSDAAEIASETFDAIFVNAGATRPADAWLNALRPGGRLLLPLTIDTELLGVGFMLLVRREPGGFPARLTSPVGIFHCTGGRTPAENDKLRDAFKRGGHEHVRSLRRDDHTAEADCWLHGMGFCLSLRE